ncbi:hypothetical protein JKP88DRAFT_289696 [Tribonema minus]|uniref:Fatty acid hydroxylase domain-containing protein n=1 Tax=Tribonema minus TaxID=303371 RepID=A0A835Z0N4_9STRA|nr:hypothetical protein JKP88DRAFT_289696 [Tribonema minus]
MVAGLAGELLLRLGGAAAFVLQGERQWEPWHIALWIVVLLAGLELLSVLTFALGRASGAKLIPHRGKHLDRLEATDVAFIAFNKLCTTLFTYQWLRVMWEQPLGMRMVWALGDADAANTVGATLALYVVFDLFYTLFHRALHHRSATLALYVVFDIFYTLFHRALHHRSDAVNVYPFEFLSGEYNHLLAILRPIFDAVNVHPFEFLGGDDAVNVHPFEFLSGEYNHLLAIFLVSRFVVPVHVAAAAVFVIAGGFMASLNHTRYDVRVGSVYQVRYHDMHHWYPDCNFGQYTMLWDRAFGSFRHFPEGSEGVQFSYDNGTSSESPRKANKSS